VTGTRSRRGRAVSLETNPPDNLRKETPVKEEDRPPASDDVTAGIDSGSTTTKAVILDRWEKLLGFTILPTGADSREASRKALETALNEAGVAPDRLRSVIATGYGRQIAYEGAETVTEITCHARGVHAALNHVRTLIDIGGQDSKAIRIDEKGRVQDFAMNDKCAAGTGRFLEVMSRTLGIPLEEMGKHAMKSAKRVHVSSMCTVFAESEVVSLVARGEKVEDILNGIHQAISDRVASLAIRVGQKPPVAITGGVAKNPGVVKALEERLGSHFSIPEEPQLTGALGAAIIAWERIRAS
jgi:(R)-2-hydroxyacyl-CoA dehydratese activating ATPase